MVLALQLGPAMRPALTLSASLLLAVALVPPRARGAKPAGDRKLGLLISAHRQKVGRVLNGIAEQRAEALRVVEEAERLPQKMYLGVTGRDYEALQGVLARLPGSIRGTTLTENQVPVDEGRHPVDVAAFKPDRHRIAIFDKKAHIIFGSIAHPASSVARDMERSVLATTIQDRGLATLRQASSTYAGDLEGPALAGTLKQVATLERIAHQRMDRRFLGDRAAFLRQLARETPDALHARAVRLIAALDYLTGGDTMRKELTAVAHLQGKIHGDAAGGFVASLDRTSLPGLGTVGDVARTLLGGEVTRAAASGGFESGIHGAVEGSYRQYQLLPASQYRIRVADLEAIRSGRAAAEDKSVIEARRIVEVALKLSDVLAALDPSSSPKAAALARWASQSTLHIELPTVARDAPPVTVRLVHTATDLLRLEARGVISSTLATRLRKELHSLVPRELQ